MAFLLNQDLRGQVHLDFKNPECLRSLSWALLKEDWNLDVTLPVDRLIPTIPLRLNYILWLEDLIVGTEHVTGIDIGDLCILYITCIYISFSGFNPPSEFLSLLVSLKIPTELRC